MSPWIWRTCPDWDDSLIDYIMFGPKIIANAPNAISGGISGIRFGHFLVGMADFTLGGGMYTQVLNIIRRDSRVRRKIPVALEMVSHIASQQRLGDPKSIGIACAAMVGFFSCFVWMNSQAYGGRTRRYPPIATATRAYD